MRVRFDDPPDLRALDPEQMVDALLKHLRDQTLQLNTFRRQVEGEPASTTVIQQTTVIPSSVSSAPGAVIVIPAQEVACDAADAALGYKDIVFTVLATTAGYTPIVWMKDSSTPPIDIAVTPQMDTRTQSGFRVLGVVVPGTIYYAALPYS